MKNALRILAVTALLALAACGSNNSSDQASATKAPPSGTINISKNNAFSPLVQDLNKAKQVNNAVQQQFQKGDNQLEAAGATSAPPASTSGP